MTKEEILVILNMIDIYASSVMDSGRAGSDELMYVNLIKRDTNRIRTSLHTLCDEDFSIEKIIQELNSFVNMDDQRDFALKLIEELMNKYDFTFGNLSNNFKD